MKTLSIKAKLLNCFFAFTLVTGLCVPSIASYAYANPAEGTASDNVIVQVEEDAVDDKDSSNQNPNIDSEDVDGVDAKVEQDASLSGETNSEPDQASQENAIADAAQSNESAIVPLDDTPSSEVTVQGYTFTGSGISAADFPVVQVNTYNVVSINTNKPLTVKTNGTATVGLYVPRGNTANLTFAGVNITAPWAIDLQSGNVANYPFTSARTGATVNYVAPGSGGTLNLVLADGTTNTIESTAAAAKQYAAGIHVGSGSKLTVDDGTPNVDISGNAIVPVNGKIAPGTVYKNGKGEVVTAGKDGDAVTELDSANPGVLNVYSHGGGAAIGGTYKEDGGTMVFNGGVILADANSKTPNSQYASGIGGGGGAAGTSPVDCITVNGGVITSKAAYHGAGIGGGFNRWELTGDTIDDIVYSKHASGTGNITINGGYITSQGGPDGNGFGTGCWGARANNCDNSDYTIFITGGTMLPSSGANSGFMDIGGAGIQNKVEVAGQDANIVITGGSVRVNKSGNTYKFKGKAYGSYYEGDNGQILPKTDNEVQIIRIDLTADLKALEPDNTNPNLDRDITYWRLLVGGEEVDYGAPARFDKGILYLWLNADQAAQSVQVELSYKGNNGESIPVEPLFRNPGSTEEKLKRYVYFDIQDNFFNEDKGTASHPSVPLSVLSDYEQKKYGKDNADDEGMITINALSKPYDGLPYSVRELSSGNPLYTGEVDNKNIWQNITYVCQYYNEQTQKLGSEISMTTTPADSGLSRFTLTSTQYSNDAEYKESYYGHRAYGWCEISRVPAVMNLTKVEWGNLKDNGDWEVVDDPKQEAGNRIKVEFNIRSQVGTALTCGVPTGQFQLMVDDIAVGEPIALTQDAVAPTDNSQPYNSFVAQNSQFSRSDNVKDKMESFDDQYVNGRARVNVTYYFDPTKTDGLLGALDQAAQATYAAALAEGDSEEDAANKANEHQISVLYIPDKNYVEGFENNEANKDDGQTVIIPVDPSTPLTPDGPVTPDDDPTDPPVTPGDQTEGIDVVQKSSRCSIYRLPS